MPRHHRRMILSDFLQWMETATPASKADAVRNLCRTYLDVDGGEEELRTTIETALTVALDDPDAEVRFAMADVLGASRAAPRHLILSLAADRADVAALVLARSPVFIDSELSEIVAAGEAAIQIAVARRQRLTSSVAATIAEAGEKQACVALLSNPFASVARLSFRRIAERFGSETDIRERLLAHADLPAEVRQMLIRAVGTALGSLVSAKQWLPEGRARVLTHEACERATITIAAETATEELPALVEHLRATEQLTTALLLRAVCAGNIEFFETALAMLARLPLMRVRSLVRGGRRSGLRAAYGKAGLPKVAFEAFAAAVEAWQQLGTETAPADRYRFTIQIVNTVLARYADITEGEANDLSAMLRRFAADQTREAARGAAREAYEAAAAGETADYEPDEAAFADEPWDDAEAPAEEDDNTLYAEAADQDEHDDVYDDELTGDDFAAFADEESVAAFGYDTSPVEGTSVIADEQETPEPLTPDVDFAASVVEDVVALSGSISEPVVTAVEALADAVARLNDDPELADEDEVILEDTSWQADDAEFWGYDAEPLLTSDTETSAFGDPELAEGGEAIADADFELRLAELETDLLAAFFAEQAGDGSIAIANDTVATDIVFDFQFVFDPAAEEARAA